MDESSSYVPSQGSSSTSRPSKRLSTTSFSSQTSVAIQSSRPLRIKTPLSQVHFPHASGISYGLGPDILAPVPRKHHILQASESPHWLGSPTLSASSSRPVSPFSLGGSHTLSPPTSRRRLSRQLSFSSLKEQEQSLASPLSAHAHERRKADSEHGGGMGRRWVRWMHKQGLKRWVVPCAVLTSVWVKWSIGLGSYSGQGTPPMYGDYEAQRHWMELTIHLPMREWYKYDLQYWGLDYPPLTAYVSWACGLVGSWINASWFALDASRGIESPESKAYMRTTVLVFDSLVYLPALFLFVRTWHANRSARTQEVALLTLLLQPTLLLVDFGHFQYNSVMLGLTLFAMVCFARGHDLLGAVSFVLSLGFKQMALYYAPAIGSYLLGKCLYLGMVQGPRHFVRLAVVTAASMLILFLPFLPPFAPLSAILDPITRIFPFNRGLFEDKVANFWCASDVILKWRRRLSPKTLVRIATGLTALGFLPGAAGLVYSGWRVRLQTRKDDDARAGAVAAREPAPTMPLLPYALLTSSLSFFLFSFQVHEKTILLPLLPLTLLLSGVTSNETSETWEIGMLVSNVALFSMWPLLKRDGLGVSYIAMTVLWNRIVGYNPFRARPNSLIQYLSLVTHAGCLVLHVLELLFSPPARYPDLFPVLNVLLSTPVFGLAWLWSIRRGVEVSWALGGLGPSSGSGTVPNTPTHHKATVSRSENGDVGEASGAAPLGIGRETGARAVSLGYAQGRRRLAHSRRTGSISSVLSAGSHHEFEQK
ncbi:glycosyltransferase family 57 protein [Rhodofomes roseus]|uniref:Alpha-1,3-glucosyltransferase n=1 Tax=Rhodofomes roseus TaxID=34475 RepID=A0ABQ8KS39_9APHY|nr:glycosyltransferase family 57 protein [Rhodofomes roseus]KAH9841629.1 glycosyltransferase family 57 protein [Rhodofomes roseus]